MYSHAYIITGLQIRKGHLNTDTDVFNKLDVNHTQMVIYPLWRTALCGFEAGMSMHKGNT
jgi:hypothetical protein